VTPDEPGTNTTHEEMAMAHDDEVRPVRVALSNDYEIALLGLAQMLARHPSQVQLVDLTTAVRPRHDPDVILYDTFGRLPREDEKLRAVVAANPDAKVVVYSWDEYPADAAKRGGAVAYLHKRLTAGELVAAIVAVHDGRTVADDVDDDDRTTTWPGQVYGLSRRESEMLSFITRGLSNQEIADRAFLGVNTVKTHVRTAYRKIGVTSRAQAVVWGFQHGFRSTDDTGL
jgi:NarL family two-component system response regulator LiaR